MVLDPSPPPLLYIRRMYECRVSYNRRRRMSIIGDSTFVHSSIVGDFTFVGDSTFVYFQRGVCLYVICVRLDEFVESCTHTPLKRDSTFVESNTYHFTFLYCVYDSTFVSHMNVKSYTHTSLHSVTHVESCTHTPLKRDSTFVEANTYHFTCLYCVHDSTFVTHTNIKSYTQSHSSHIWSHVCVHDSMTLCILTLCIRLDSHTHDSTFVTHTNIKSYTHTSLHSVTHVESCTQKCGIICVQKSKISLYSSERCVFVCVWEWNDMVRVCAHDSTFVCVKWYVFESRRSCSILQRGVCLYVCESERAFKLFSRLYLPACRWPVCVRESVCVPLQIDTATTVQRTATRCNTLQHAADALQHTY